MSKWKLTRQNFGTEEFTVSEGDNVTVGRGINNIITLSSAVISRNHCVIQVQNNRGLITDLKSSNGVYVGTTKIPPNTPYVIQDSDIIGLGWTIGAPLVNINDSEKYVFKFIKENCRLSITNKIRFQSETELDEIDEIEYKIAKLDQTKNNKSPVLNTRAPLKRKMDHINVKEEPRSEVDDVVHIVLSDSDNETRSKPLDTGAKKTKLEPICEEQQKPVLKDIDIKHENDLEFDAFNVKQEYMGYDEPIAIDSDSDSESEQWLIRLSQSSPGKPFMKMAKSPKVENTQEDSSYSQLDDFVCMSNLDLEENDDEDDDDFVDDLISLPLPPPDDVIHKVPDMTTGPQVEDNESEELFEHIIPTKQPVKDKDEIDGYNMEEVLKEADILLKSPIQDSVKKAQLIEPMAHGTKHKSNQVKIVEIKPKSSSSRHHKDKSSSKRHISNSQKEERKRKLKEIACKEKETESIENRDSSGSNKPISTNVKITTTNRGAFLTDVAQAIVNPVKRKEHVPKAKLKDGETSPQSKEAKGKDVDVNEDLENKRKVSEKTHRDKSKSSKHKRHSKTENVQDKVTPKPLENEKRLPLKSIKPLTDGEVSFSGKPVSKVGPMKNDKQKKVVRFSEIPPQVLVFEIEPGNRMKKTSLVKTMVDVRQAPVFSLEKLTLMKILRWNPQWFEEQLNNTEPPPILGHNNPPMSVFHSFVNHNQYVQLIGDLLLMEIWEYLSLAYMKIRKQNNGIELRIESLPPIPSHERCLELFSLSVNVSVPDRGSKMLPRVGEVLLVTFGPEQAKNQRFFYVHNVRCLPSPPSNRNAFYSISLHATYTDKMRTLKPGELMIGRNLAYINKELQLFEAMEYLAGSPLSDAILRPEPRHFVKSQQLQSFDIQSQWTRTLNPSQLTAVSSSVAAALGDKPSIQMVQGPPGTGKSSVICAIVMTYFYNAQVKKQQNRAERFRMVRVGREEAMHPEAANISSQQLAKRDLDRIHSDQPPAPAGLNEEILHIEAKINMWRTQAQDAKDQSRVAYCQGRVDDLMKRMALLRTGSGRAGGGEAVRPEQLAHTERRIIEGADIVVTTLASAQNYKMKGLKRRIALCIIDEAGQVMEPETLVPLTLDVTRLTLIGDPQQLPGFICSQRAKRHGLNESLFSRLSSCTEQWPGGSPVVLLNQQYRMQPDIADYPSRAFYDGRIISVPPTRPDIDIPAYNIISISSGDKGQGVSGANEMEAWGVSRLVAALLQRLRPRRLRLAVITPYNAHKDLIKKHLRMLQLGDNQVEVNTIDSFQGQERDVVVVSLARSQGVGFLTDAGRMNVMLTRAKHALLVCLNPHALIKNHQWRTLVEDAQRRNLYKELPNKMCQPITAAQLPSDNILSYITNKSHR
uniref:FHA domain-containing protein n=1 Tax=Heliothis virescens TaxID=7102 RepID=A0A2A4JSD2_HELVI